MQEAILAAAKKRRASPPITHPMPAPAGFVDMAERVEPELMSAEERKVRELLLQGTGALAENKWQPAAKVLTRAAKEAARNRLLRLEVEGRLALARELALVLCVSGNRR